VKNSNFYIVLQNLVKIRRSAAELLRIIDFENGGRLPSWIWNDVIADHPRLASDGPNILLKLHIGRFNILRDIAIFIFAPFGLKLPPFWGGGYEGFPLGIGHRRNGSNKKLS